MTSKTPWTPGPWHVDESANISSTAVKGGGDWAVCACRFKAPWGQTTKESIAIGKANARLIAAAPEMAELIAGAMTTFRALDPDDTAWFERARALLARIGAS